MNFTPEQITKAKAAKSAEELLALAKAEGVAITGEEAAKYFADLHKEGELSDDELAGVSGGGCGEDDGPKQYETYIYWAPWCDGDYECDPRSPYGTDIPCCGNCIHGSFLTTTTAIMENTKGYCNREFHKKK